MGNETFGNPINFIVGISVSLMILGLNKYGKGLFKEIIKECVMMLVYNQKIHIEKVNNENLIYLMPYYLAENGVCSQI
ncbi:hypothetical protein ACTPEF_23535, partial [Clostridioides difficile]